MKIKKSYRSAWEYFAVVSIVGLSMLLAMSLYAKRDHLQKEQIRQWELLALRNAVIAYTLEHKKHPDDLGLVTRDQGPGTNPFGEPYHYDPKTGRVW